MLYAYQHKMVQTSLLSLHIAYTRIEDIVTELSPSPTVPECVGQCKKMRSSSTIHYPKIHTNTYFNGYRYRYFVNLFVLKKNTGTVLESTCRVP
jgi:hypothetical protein